MVTTYLLWVISSKKARKTLRYKKLVEDKHHNKHCVIIFYEALDNVGLRYCTVLTD